MLRPFRWLLVGLTFPATALKHPLDVNCRAICQKTPACRDGFTSYCKWWQREAVCFGLYWMEPGEACFQPRESSCLEGLPVRCADSVGGQGPGPVAASEEDQVSSATHPVVTDVALEGKYCGTIAMMLPLTLQLAGDSFDVSSPHLQSVSGVPFTSRGSNGGHIDITIDHHYPPLVEAYGPFEGKSSLNFKFNPVTREIYGTAYGLPSAFRPC